MRNQLFYFICRNLIEKLNSKCGHCLVYSLFVCLLSSIPFVVNCYIVCCAKVYQYGRMKCVWNGVTNFKALSREYSTFLWKVRDKIRYVHRCSTPVYFLIEYLNTQFMNVYHPKTKWRISPTLVWTWPLTSSSQYWIP